MRSLPLLLVLLLLTQLVAAAAESPFAGELTLVKAGFKKLDTPAWLPQEKTLLVAELDPAKLYRLTGEASLEVARENATRGTTTADGRWLGVLDNRLVLWSPDKEPQVVAAQAAGGRELSLNDIVAGKSHAYFTTLKDPDKGRLSIVDLASGQVRVAWEGEEQPKLWNPNGVTLSPDGRWLYVVISSYADRKKSGIYRFAVGDDGSLDVAAGQERMWAPITGPDGLATDREGNIYATVGGKIVPLDPAGKKLGELKIPKGSGTNLCFAGDEMTTLYVTTNEALYRCPVRIPGLRH